MEDGEEDSHREKRVKRFLDKANQYNEIADVGEIARRAFGNNAFDGILTMIGVIIGSYTSGIVNPHVVITTGLSTSIAIMISGAWGAYLTESAERKKDIDELSRHTLSDLNGSHIEKASRFAIFIVSLVDGLSPFLGAIVVLLPFFFSHLFASIQAVYFAALATALVALFALGIWLGKVAKENLLGYALKTLLAGIVSIIIGSLLNGN